METDGPLDAPQRVLCLSLGARTRGLIRHMLPRPGAALNDHVYEHRTPTIPRHSQQ
jgi:hypothetical protein